jgi:hypothetical protein
VSLNQSGYSERGPSTKNGLQAETSKSDRSFSP